MPWKWIAVLSFPSPLYALILIVSPTLRPRAGHGHCPLMPTKGRSNPSGAALTHPIFQLKVLNFGLGILVDAETTRTCKTKIRSVFANIFRTVVTVPRNPLKLKRMLSSLLHVQRPLLSRNAERMNWRKEDESWEGWLRDNCHIGKSRLHVSSATKMKSKVIATSWKIQRLTCGRGVLISELS